MAPPPSSLLIVGHDVPRVSPAGGLASARSKHGAALSLPDRRMRRPQDDDTGIVFHVGMSYAEVEREILLKTLAHYDGDKAETARVLGVSVRTIHNQLARLALGERSEPHLPHA